MRFSHQDFREFLSFLPTWQALEESIRVFLLHLVTEEAEYPLPFWQARAWPATFHCSCVCLEHGSTGTKLRVLPEFQGAMRVLGLLAQCIPERVWPDFETGYVIQVFY